MRQPGKVGTVFSLVRHRYHSCDLDSSAMLLAQLYTLWFKHCDLLVQKIRIMWEAVCITLYSQNPNTTFKIRFWVFPRGLWRARSSERRAMPSKLMKRGWKYPLKHTERGEGTPLKDHHHYHHHHHQSLNREGRWGTTDDFATSFLHFFPVLHCPLGLAKLQACPFPDVVFPPLPLSALSSSPFSNWEPRETTFAADTFWRRWRGRSLNTYNSC